MKKTIEDQLQIMKTSIEILINEYKSFQSLRIIQLERLALRIDQIIKEETK
jgi:hypothetical protein